MGKQNADLTRLLREGGSAPTLVRQPAPVPGTQLLLWAALIAVIGTVAVVILFGLGAQRQADTVDQIAEAVATGMAHSTPASLNVVARVELPPTPSPTPTKMPTATPRPTVDPLAPCQTETPNGRTCRVTAALIPATPAPTPEPCATVIARYDGGKGRACVADWHRPTPAPSPTHQGQDGPR